MVLYRCIGIICKGTQKKSRHQNDTGIFLFKCCDIDDRQFLAAVLQG